MYTADGAVMASRSERLRQQHIMEIHLAGRASARKSKESKTSTKHRVAMVELELELELEPKLVSWSLS